MLSLTHSELTVSSLGHQLSCSSNGLGENPHYALPYSRDDPSGLATSRALRVPVPLEVLHGLVHDAGYCSCRTQQQVFVVN